MEMFRPEIEGDILYIDLDTAVVGSLADVAAAGKLTVLSDFYKPEMIGSGLMFWPEEERARIWRAWIGNPERHMRRCRTREKWGDQGFLQPLVLDRADRWQDVLPGQVVSYKLHVRPARMHGREFGTGKVPPGARLICFHGRPRPWHAGW